MIEFNDTLDTVLTGKEAVVQRVTTRLKHTTQDIPYYDRGIDIFEFTYGTASSAIRMGLRDFGASVTVDNETSRIQVYDVSIPYDSSNYQE